MAVGTRRLNRTHVAAVGDSYDNALAEKINGLYKTELIKPRRPWKTFEQVEVATAEWMDWFNHRRLYEYCGDLPPADLEEAFHGGRADRLRQSPDMPGGFRLTDSNC